MPSRLVLTMSIPLFVLLAVDAAAAATGDPPPERVRFAVFNVWELSLDKLDVTVDDDRAGGRVGGHPQLRAAAEIVQRVRPDVLLVNEIDFDPERSAAELFLERYLRVPQRGRDAVDYEHVVYEPVNTGVASGFDLNRDGDADDPEDAWGFGRYPGQYGMALYSRFPVDRDGLRTFRTLAWRAMPGHHLPDGRDGRPAWYGAEAASRLRLSSKSHWDVPVRIPTPGGGGVVHVLAAHPTPPVFDGDEDRNGRRNFDEIRLWADYLSGGEAASWIVDDQGLRGGLAQDAVFVVLGDLNADPVTDSAPYGRTAISQLLDHPRVHDPEPRGHGPQPGGRDYPGDPAVRTSAYGRIDYALPGRGLEVLDAGVFLPAADSPLRSLVEGEQRASDHQLVWVDVRWPPASTPQMPRPEETPP